MCNRPQKQARGHYVDWWCNAACKTTPMPVEEYGSDFTLLMYKVNLQWRTFRETTTDYHHTHVHPRHSNKTTRTSYDQRAGLEFCPHENQKTIVRKNLFSSHRADTSSYIIKAGLHAHGQSLRGMNLYRNAFLTLLSVKGCCLSDHHGDVPHNSKQWSNLNYT